MRSSLVKKKRAETEPSILLSQTKNQKKYEDAPEIDIDKSAKNKPEIDKLIDTIPENSPKEEEQKSDNE
jgi:hypothetical protein